MRKRRSFGPAYTGSYSWLRWPLSCISDSTARCGVAPRRWRRGCALCLALPLLHPLSSLSLSLLSSLFFDDLPLESTVFLRASPSRTLAPSLAPPPLCPSPPASLPNVPPEGNLPSSESISPLFPSPSLSLFSLPIFLFLRAAAAMANLATFHPRRTTRGGWTVQTSARKTPAVTRVTASFSFLCSSRCRGVSSRGGCFTGAEVAGTAPARTTNSSRSNSSNSNTASSFKRPSTCRPRGLRSRPRPQRRRPRPRPSTIPSPALARLLGK